ncbi:atlastin-3-like [Ornithodoros turicata]|uniref:atlastin-3-like n=1 Tax=Ornithodoros turicata TaxID=34597 RepID=UPI0031389379
MASGESALQGTAAAYLRDTAMLERARDEYASALKMELLEALERKNGIGALDAAHKRLKQQSLLSLESDPTMQTNIKALQEQLSNMIECYYTNCCMTLSRALKEPELKDGVAEPGGEQLSEEFEKISYFGKAKRKVVDGLSAAKDAIMHSKPQPLHVIVPSDMEENQYLLKREVFENKAWKEVEHLPVVVVSVAGVFRTGKSFLLDYLIRYLEHIESHGNTENWMGDPNQPLDGFSWKYGRKKHTRGILFWEKIFKVNTPSGTVAVVLMDTEGSCDNTSTLAANTTLFSLSMLLSSVLIYNVMKNLNQSIVENLQFCANYASMIKNMEGRENDQSNQAFQKLLFLVRDWDFADDIPYGLDVDRKVVHEWLHFDEEVDAKVNEMRANVTANITDMDCFLMPYPGKKLRSASFDGRVSDLSEEFKHHLTALVRFLFSPNNLAPKLVNGGKLTCKEFAVLLKTYFMICKEGKLPEVQSVYNVTAFVHNNKILRDIQNDYASALHDEFPKVLESGGGLEALEAVHSCLKSECMSKLEKAPIMGRNMEAIQVQLSDMIDCCWTSCRMTFCSALKEVESARARGNREEEYKAELEKVRAQRAELEEEKKEMSFKEGEDVEEYRRRLRGVVMRCMESQGVHLEEEDKQKLADDIVEDNPFVSRILRYIAAFFGRILGFFRGI